MDRIEELLTDEVLQAQATIPPDASELWSLCRGWSQEKRRLRSELAAGCYRFGLLSHVTLKGGEVDRHLAAPRRLGAKGALAGVGTVLWILDQMLLGKGPRRKQARRAQRVGSSHHQSLFTAHRREGFLRFHRSRCFARRAARSRIFAVSVAPRSNPALRRANYLRSASPVTSLRVPADEKGNGGKRTIFSTEDESSRKLTRRFVDSGEKNYSDF